MLIRIVYNSGHFDMVRPETLARLLNAHQVDQFQRASGWVRVGHDPVRTNSNPTYTGPERRHQSD